MPALTLLLLVQLGAEPPSFVVQVQASGGPEVAALAAGIAARARETWQAEVVGDDAPLEVAPRFVVRVAWAEPSRIEVRVLEAERELSARQIVVDEPGAARLLAWMVVRASIDRALLDATLPAGDEQEPVDAPAAAAAPAPTPVAAVPPPPVGGPPRGWQLGGAMTAAWSSPELVGLGPALLLAYHHAIGWLGLEAGYLLTPLADTGARGRAITLHELRLALLAALAWPASEVFSAGGTVIVSLERATTQERAAGGVGLDAGGFVQARLALAGVGAAANARLALLGRPVRHRYLVDGGRLREGPVAVHLTLGVGWP